LICGCAHYVFGKKESHLLTLVPRRGLVPLSTKH
jgi:hypothetical protein